MQVEQSIVEASALQIASETHSDESEKSKSKRGGKRPGAGRKPNYAKRLLSGVKPITAAEAIEGVNIKALVHDLLKNGSRQVKLQTLTVLWDRIYGKPKQDVAVSGAFVHAHTRDPRLAALPQEALLELARAYDEVLVKHLPNAGQDGPQNQTESTLAIEAVEVKSEADPEQKPSKVSHALIRLAFRVDSIGSFRLELRRVVSCVDKNRTHNPKVVSSNLTPATNLTDSQGLPNLE